MDHYFYNDRYIGCYSLTQNDHSHILIIEVNYLLQNIFINVLLNMQGSILKFYVILFCRQTIKNICVIIFCIHERTFVAVPFCISRIASLVTISSLFVTWRIIQTVPTAVVDTSISIGPIITFCFMNTCIK